MYVDGLIFAKDEQTIDVDFIRNLVESNPIVEDIKSKYYNKDIRFAYSQGLKGNVINVYIYLEGDSFNTAKILSSIKELLNVQEIRKKFYVIYAFDGVSDYYSRRLFPLITEFESKLRSLIYMSLINNHGISWISETIDKIDYELDESNKIKKELLRNSNGSFDIDNALQNFTLSTYEKFLFTRYSDSTYEEIVNNIEAHYFENILDDYSISHILMQKDKKSICNRYIKINNEIKFKSLFKKILKIRNKVMHGKEVTLKEYKVNKGVLSDSIFLIESSIELYMNNEYYINENNIYSSIRKTKYEHLNLDDISSKFLDAYERSYEKDNEMYIKARVKKLWD